MTFLVLVKKEILGMWRTYRLLVILVVLTVFSMLSPLLAKFMPQLFEMIPGGEQFSGLIPPPTVMDAVDQYLKNIVQFGILLALLVSMGSVAQEKDKGTAAILLAKPVGRCAFILAKFTALALAFLVSMAVAGYCGYFYTQVLFEPLSPGLWWQMNGLILLYMLVYVGITLFFSTLSRSQALAAAGGLGTLMLMGLLGISPAIKKVLPDALVGAAKGAFLGVSIDWTPLWVTAGLVAVTVAAACLVFRRQEL